MAQITAEPFRINKFSSGSLLVGINSERESFIKNASTNAPSFYQGSREFKKLRRQLQRKRQIKIELCVNLSLLRLFQVDHVVQNRRTTLSLAWYEWFFMKRQRVKDLLLRARVVVRALNTKISRRRLADYVKTLHQKACRTCSTIIFFIQPIKSLICGVVVDVAVVKS